jgi:hypothetical protein
MDAHEKVLVSSLWFFSRLNCPQSKGRILRVQAGLIVHRLSFYSPFFLHHLLIIDDQQ